MTVSGDGGDGVLSDALEVVAAVTVAVARGNAGVVHDAAVLADDSMEPCRARVYAVGFADVDEVLAVEGVEGEVGVGRILWPSPASSGPGKFLDGGDGGEFLMGVRAGVRGVKISGDAGDAEGQEFAGDEAVASADF